MSHISKNVKKWIPLRLPSVSSLNRSSKPRWYNVLIVFLVVLIVLDHIHNFSYAEFSRLFHESDDLDISDTDLMMMDDEVTKSPKSGNLTEVVIEMNDRVPTFKLATKSGEKPASESDQGLNQLYEELHLQETCQRDSSTIVVDVGASLGNFGLYAAACGCTVYMFEIKKELITLIQSSMNHNTFTSPPVNVFNKAVSDMPTDSTMDYRPPDDAAADSISIQTIRLDDVEWSATSIYILKIDVEGSEQSVLRSAENLFSQKRIQNVILKYSPWLAEQTQQKSLLMYMRRDLKARFIYSLYPTTPTLYGPLVPMHFTTLNEQLSQVHAETHIYASFDSKATRSSIKSEPFASYKP
ncbi:unnamed protein product [Adineta steineri]|uniref:Methyltransferase FkbM domain-containing protein n=1 Tax=Adineta steineri TaxID=433720 RepID=A0A819QQ94_9BILA|nr:unnamed protein product [Adineta steineri]CAF4032513.1 unnamed protein product [Adineta steineri]